MFSRQYLPRTSRWLDAFDVCYQTNMDVMICKDTVSELVDYMPYLQLFFVASYDEKHVWEKHSTPDFERRCV